MLKVVIFDIDGTLVNAYPSIFMSVERTLKDLNYPPTTYEEVKRNVGGGQRILLQAFLKPEDMDRGLELYGQHSEDVLPDGVEFFPGTQSVLNDLGAAGFMLAVASNRPHRFSRMVLEHLDVAQRFAHIVCIDDVARGKPEPDMLNEILQRMSLEPDEALYVGDMDIDAHTGQRAGIKTVVVTTGSSTRQEIEAAKPWQVIESIDEVPSMVKSLL